MLHTILCTRCLFPGAVRTSFIARVMRMRRLLRSQNASHAHCLFPTSFVARLTFTRRLLRTLHCISRDRFRPFSLLLSLLPPCGLFRAATLAPSGSTSTSTASQTRLARYQALCGSAILFPVHRFPRFFTLASASISVPLVCNIPLELNTSRPLFSR